MSKTKLIIVGLILLILVTASFKVFSFLRRGEIISDNRISWLTKTLIAHRGIHNNNDTYENTISAFDKAIREGYIIELDVSMTKDKKLVVFHDKKLKRIFEMDLYLKDINYDELQKLKFPHSDETIPLFSQVLDFVGGKVPLLIEIKNEGEVGEMERVIYSELAEYKGKYAVQSFNPYTIAWFRNNAPEIIRGQLSGNFIISDYDVEYAGTTRLPWYKRFILSNLLLNFKSRPNFIAYEIKNTNIRTFKNFKRLGVPILGWTVRDISEYKKVKDVCDNFIVEIFDIISNN